MTARTLRLAHRGDWRHAPENTIAAFEAALAVPACDGLEFDVRLSADGVPVICHDVTLLRIQGVPERVDALTATALGELGVPTLESVLEVVGPQPFLDVEIKDDPSPAIVEVLEAGRGPGLERAVVSSFDPATLDFIGRRAPGWPRWLISHTLDDADIAWARALGCAGICVQWRALRPGAIRHAQESDLEVISWTVRRRSTFDRLERLGIVASAVEASALDG